MQSRLCGPGDFCLRQASRALYLSMRIYRVEPRSFLEEVCLSLIDILFFYQVQPE